MGHRLIAIILSNLNQFQKKFTARFLGKFAVKHLLKSGVVNNEIKKGLLLSLRVKTVFKLVNIWQSYKQQRDCLVQFLRLLAVCLPGTQFMRQSRCCL